ncbi:MAG: B3/B4 domain-containing protein [Blastocatellia bacterium]
MNYKIRKEIFELFPDYCRAVVVGRDINNCRPVPEIGELLRQEIATIASDPIVAPAHPKLIAWDNAYRKFGADPDRYTPSIRFLTSLVKAGKPIRSISPVVDLFNTFSLRYLMPCGADDIDSVAPGDLELGIADGTEQFSPLFKPTTIEHPTPGEVIYYVHPGRRVLCRRWNWRNADFSKIQPETRNVAVNLDGMIPQITRDELEEAAVQLAGLLSQYCGGESTVEYLDYENPSFTF